jgi:alpha-tubulin suppressor-like RCC1 family protein
MGRDNGGWGTNVPTPIRGLGGAAEIAVGNDFACARDAADGSIWCWGLDEYGQQGRGLLDAGADGSFLDTNHYLPGRVAGITGSVSLSLGDFQACAVLGDGTVRCWGLNNGPCTGSPGGQLGHPTTTDPTCFRYWLCDPTPQVVGGLPPAREVVSGTWESCAVLRDDTVACWGVNERGELGHDPSLDLDSGCGPYQWQPARVAGLSNVAHVALHDVGGCAVTWDDRVLCWGLLATGADGGETKSSSPVEVQL